MNGNPHEQHERRRPIPEPERERELAESTGTPDAVGAAHIRRDDQEHTPAGRRARGVEWVRPTDLIARHGATLSGRGIDFEAELARRARAPIANRLQDLTDRARRLPPLSAFGRSGNASSWPVRAGVGMNR